MGFALPGSLFFPELYSLPLPQDQIVEFQIFCLSLPSHFLIYILNLHLSLFRRLSHRHSSLFWNLGLQPWEAWAVDDGRVANGDSKISFQLNPLPSFQKIYFWFCSRYVIYFLNFKDFNLYKCLFIYRCYAWYLFQASSCHLFWFFCHAYKVCLNDILGFFY